MRGQDLFEATYRTAVNLGIVTEGVATGGSVTTLADTRILTQAADYWNNGTLWLLRDSAEAAAAPEGEFARVTDYEASTDQLTLGPVSAGSGNAFTASAAAGDRYAVGKARYPVPLLIQKVNEALVRMGTIPITDTTTITTASSQTEYTMPIAANMDLREIWLQTKTGDTNDNQWEKIEDWDVQRTATGSADLLVIPRQLPVSRSLKLVYLDVHPSLDDASDVISESVHMDRVVMEATLGALIWRQQKVGAGDPSLRDQIGYYRTLLEPTKSTTPIRKPTRDKLLTLGSYVAEDEFTTPSA